MDTVGELYAGLAGAGALNSPTAMQTALNSMGAGTVSKAQALALWSMFSNSEVQVMLGGMAAAGAPTTMLTDAMTGAQPLVSFMKNLSPAARAAIFSSMNYSPAAATTYNNDTNYTNRFRLNLRAKAMENLEFKARLAMYKVWGMQNNTVDYSYNNGMGGGQFMLSSLAFDGSATRQPQDSVLRVDRAFMNWNAIGGTPVWFSIGRRPVTDGPPNHLRMGTGEKMATPVAYMDYPFDGLSLGYAYENLFGIQDAPGRVRLCYGRGFESGPTDNGNGLNDVDFGGLSWDVYEKGNRFLNFQSFGAFNMFNVPDNVTFVNPIEFALWEKDNTQYNPLNSSKDLQLNRANLGDIFHTSTVYMSKVQNLNYFVTGGWSRTNARGMDELGTSLLGSWWEEPKDHDGYSVLVGMRYDLDSLGLKLGAEYNWGSEYWISFTPGHDDLYASKLATRGNVYELYTVYDIPAGAAISKFSKAFIRLGYQHYDYKYTGSGFWLGAPQKIDDLANDPLAAQFYVPVDKMDQVYMTMEAWF
ncbi:MAG: DUF3373 domain-containing protein [Desulfobulbaceae bacterium]|nr:DUF3373 domain-containing protein [Desulfobulbaceae bacterium]